MAVKPYIDYSKCIKCGTCVNVCPMQVFIMKDKPEVAHPEKCVQCKACEVSCPTQAIKVK
ncbi:MAG: ferredoxin family protein [Candidatus Diapherotrites archaeon]|nr:ferredoxin family protein [Candidatus Diapherotrites archaeon]